MFGGCTPFPNYAFYHRRIQIDDSDKLRSASEAREALKGLQDSSVFSEQKIASMEVGEFSLTLKGFDQISARNRTHAYVLPPIFGADQGLVENGVTNQQVRREQLNIWFKEIKKVVIYYQQFFDREESQFVPDKPKRTNYNCLLELEDGTTVLFVGNREAPVKRLGLAFAMLSNSKLQDGITYSKFGCIFDPQTGAIVGLDINGMAAKIGLPLFSRIVALDDVPIGNQREISQIMDELAEGPHVVTYKGWGSLISSEALIPFEELPPKRGAK
jgi:hypothetical protein